MEAASRDVINKLWSEFLNSEYVFKISKNNVPVRLEQEKGWSFTDTMQLFSDPEFAKLNGISSENILTLVNLSEFLAYNNGIWMKWFKNEIGMLIEMGYPTFTRIFTDPRMPKYRGVFTSLVLTENSTPPEWILAIVSRTKKKLGTLEAKAAQENKLFNHEDKLFVDVPWRSFYMWGRFFQKMSGKYILGIVKLIKEKKFNREEFTQSMEESLKGVKVGGTHQGFFEDKSKKLPLDNIVRDWYEMNDMHAMKFRFLSNWQSAPMPTPFLLWLMFVLFQKLRSVHNQKYHLDSAPDVDAAFTFRLGHKNDEIFTYNVDIGSSVKCFMFWFINQMIHSDSPIFVEHIGKPGTKNFDDTMGYSFHATDKNGKLIKHTVAYEMLVESSGCFDRKKGTYSYLEDLPIAPRRYIKDKHGTPFLGDMEK